jgi:hypothetical protein
MAQSIRQCSLGAKQFLSVAHCQDREENSKEPKVKPARQIELIRGRKHAEHYRALLAVCRFDVLQASSALQNLHDFRWCRKRWHTLTHCLR